MTTYNIKNQDDFNKAYSKASVKERGRLGFAFPEFYDAYQNMDVARFQEAIKAKAKQKSDEAERKINEALRQDIREETLKAVAGKENKYFKPFENQQQRDKYANYLKGQKQSAPKTIQEKIVAYANQVGLDPKLALAVAKQESGFNPNAIGDGGKSFGLFQIHTPSHPDYKGGTNVEANIKYGINLLKKLYDKYKGDIKKTLWAYNAGSGNVDKGILPGSTKKYIANITANMGNPNLASTPTTSTEAPQVSQPIEATQINLNDFKKALGNIYSSEDAQEGGLNYSYDISDLDLNKPALIRQQIASELNRANPANDYFGASQQYYKNAYNLARQAGGYGLQPTQGEQREMMNNNQMAPVPSPEQYSMMLNEMRPYAQLDNQPQNIRGDVLDDYMKLMQSLRGQQDQQNQALMTQMQKAQSQDDLINRANMIANIASNEPTRAPSTWVTPWGTVTQQYDQTRPLNLPTNVSTNMDKFRNQLALQAKAQQNDKDLLDRYQAMIAANQMSEVTGLPAGVFLDKDLYKTYAQYIQNPDIAQQAQFKREAGMAPINLSSDLAKQSLVNAGNLDVANVNAQADLGKAGVTGEYQLANTQLANAMQGANDYRKAMLSNQTAKDINKATLTAQVMMANMNNENKLKIAQQAGANALQLAELQDALYSNNPVRVQNANAQLTNAMANLMYLNDNPEMGFDLYNRIINMGNPTQAPSGELTPDIWNE